MLVFLFGRSFILDKAHGLNARPVCGAAFFRVHDASNTVLSFADLDAFANDEVDSHPEAFHAWIECNGMVIDLLAPIFRENLLAIQPDSVLRLPRMMFQKPLSEMAESPFDLKREGQFFLQVNPVLSNKLLKEFSSKLGNGDLIDVCRHWYKPTPKPIPGQLALGSDDGSQTLMMLDKRELVGKW